MKILLSILASFFISVTSFCADWTVLVFVQARNNLSNFATKNLSDMASIGSNRNMNVLVQWYQPGQSGIWRYKIEKNKIDLDVHLPQNSDGSNSADLVDSMQWAATKYPAQNYFLILWNHGVGILDPIWNGSQRLGFSGIPNDNPKLQITDLTKKIDSELDQKLDHRGILFNEFSRTYMNNQELAGALKKIKKDVLKNKKLDVLGMDACLMAMLEVSYQIKSYAKYMVASQEVELAHGWDYLNLLKGLSYGNISPVMLAQSIVLTYEQFYKNKIQFYTQSAINLEKIDFLKDGLNQIIKDTNECLKYDKSNMQNLLKSSRSLSLQFSNRNYIDLYSFFSQFSKKLESFYSQTNIEKIKNQKNKYDIKKTTDNLKNSLKLGMQLIENSVIAKTAGTNLACAKGLSIYFPSVNRIDDSYYKTKFAKDSLWIQFLQQYFAK